MTDKSAASSKSTCSSDYRDIQRKAASRRLFMGATVAIITLLVVLSVFAMVTASKRSEEGEANETVEPAPESEIYALRPKDNLMTTQPSALRNMKESDDTSVRLYTRVPTRLRTKVSRRKMPSTPRASSPPPASKAGATKRSTTTVANLSHESGVILTDRTNATKKEDDLISVKPILQGKSGTHKVRVSQAPTKPTATDPVQSDRRNLEDEEYDEGAEIVGGSIDGSSRREAQNGILFCTVGPSKAEEDIYPIQEHLCDYIVYTHVTVIGDNIVVEDATNSFELFKNVSKDNRNNPDVQFGVSLSPDFVASNQSYGKPYSVVMKNAYTHYGISVYGSLGFPVNESGLASQRDLMESLKEMSRGLTSLNSGFKKFFVGVRLEMDYSSLRLDKRRQIHFAAKLMSFTEWLRVDLLVLITHTWPFAKSQGRDQCVTAPTSLWARPEGNGTDINLPDLETSVMVLSKFHSAKTKAFLSLTLGAMRYTISEEGESEEKVFGKTCIVESLTSLFEVCSIKPRTNSLAGRENSTLMTWNATSSVLFTYDDLLSITDKVKRCLEMLQSNGQTMVGWALFDINHELYRVEDCDPQSIKFGNYSRIKAVRTLLDSYT